MVGGTENLNAGHVVQFYGHEQELSDRVAGYLLAALKRDGVAIVIATQAHRRAFEARLADAGADLASAARSGAYLALDASRTADALMGDGRLDRDRFDRVIGGLIRRAGRGGAPGRPVCAYGEMVAVLWDAGLVSAAVQLEQLWADLGRRHSFSLLCGYPAGSVIRDGHLDAFAEVCRLHDEVISSQPVRAATRTFAFSREAPAAARHFAVEALRRLGAVELADDAALVVTELAANAVVHAHSAFTVDLAVGPDLLRISVRDASPLPPGAAAALPAAPLHGLGAVAALASRWGAEPAAPAGKAVWAELRRPPRSHDVLGTVGGLSWSMSGRRTPNAANPTRAEIPSAGPTWSAPSAAPWRARGTSRCAASRRPRARARRAPRARSAAGRPASATRR